MPRTNVTTTKLSPIGWGNTPTGPPPGTTAQPALDLDGTVGTTIDATLVTNGVRLICNDVHKVLLWITNTSVAGKVVTVRRPTPQADTTGYGVQDFLSTAIAATSGARLIGPLEGGPQSGGVTQPDGTISIDFAAGHTGLLLAVELP